MKTPSAALPSSFVIAEYTLVRLIPQDFGRLASGAFLITLEKIFSATCKYTN
jgi:hypothetical protein